MNTSVPLTLVVIVTFLGISGVWSSCNCPETSEFLNDGQGPFQLCGFEMKYDSPRDCEYYGIYRCRNPGEVGEKHPRSCGACMYQRNEGMKLKPECMNGDSMQCFHANSKRFCYDAELLAKTQVEGVKKMHKKKAFAS